MTGKKLPEPKKEYSTFILYDDVAENDHHDDDGNKVATSAELFVRRFLVTMTFSSKVLPEHAALMTERIQDYCEQTFHETLFTPTSSKTKQAKKDIFDKHHKKRKLKHFDFTPAKKKGGSTVLFDHNDVKKLIEDNVLIECQDLLKDDGDDTAKYLKLKAPTIDVEECLMDIDGTKTLPSKTKEKHVIKIDL